MPVGNTGAKVWLQRKLPPSQTALPLCSKWRKDAQVGSETGCQIALSLLFCCYTKRSCDWFLCNNNCAEDDGEANVHYNFASWLLLFFSFHIVLIWLSTSGWRIELIEVFIYEPLDADQGLESPGVVLVVCLEHNLLKKKVNNVFFFFLICYLKNCKLGVIFHKFFFC